VPLAHYKHHTTTQLQTISDRALYALHQPTIQFQVLKDYSLCAIASNHRSHSPTMSILGAEVQAELTQLLQALQSSDNTTRSTAEEVLQSGWSDPRPSILLLGLVELMSESQSPGVRI